jgi:beta-glucanase (GH16 family)
MKVNKTSLFFVIALFFVLNSKSQGQCKRLVWEENFNYTGVLNPTYWNYETEPAQFNNEIQYYTNRLENAIVENGVLKIRTQRENYLGQSRITSARVNTQNKYSFQYGRVDVRAKIPVGVGTWPAIWMLGGNISSVGWPACGETDIMEHVGRNLNRIYGTLHYPGRSGGNADGNSTVIPTATSEFHIYSLDWTANWIKIYVDDILVHSVANSNAIPYNHPFFFILNTAMGGDFGGAVDPSFTNCTMEIDYIRVYDTGYSISGADTVLANQIRNYTIENIPGVTYNWTVPAGATITAGQGTNTITVNWANQGGNVSVTTTAINPCSNANAIPVNTYGLKVKVFGQNSAIYEDYQLTPNIVYNASAGTYSPNIANPSISGVNTSSNVGRYVRNGGVQYDTMTFTTTLNDAADFKSGSKRFAMDVYTSAPVGTQISWQMENFPKNSANYPSGRHSVYAATVQQTNTWHTLLFSLSGTPDVGTLDSEVNRFVLLFNPNSYTNATYFMDNLRSLRENALSTITFDDENLIQIFPNPTAEFLNLKLPDMEESKELTITGVDGKLLVSKMIEPNLSEYIINLVGIPAGINLITLKAGNKVRSRKFIKQ